MWRLVAPKPASDAFLLSLLAARPISPGSQGFGAGRDSRVMIIHCRKVHPMQVGALLARAFAAARDTHKELNTTWIGISARIGSQLPASLLMVSIQREGELDLLLRCMEDDMSELTTKGGNDSLFVGHYLNVMTAYWIGGVYEIFRLLRERSLVEKGELFSAVFKDLELVRIPLEKHEIAKDRTLKEPLLMIKRPPNNDATDNYTYKSDDTRRAHIMPTGISARGSIMWEVIDLKNNAARWVERRTISDQILQLWKC
jgi:hypothetical protein